MYVKNYIGTQSAEYPMAKLSRSASHSLSQWQYVVSQSAYQQIEASDPSDCSEIRERMVKLSRGKRLVSIAMAASAGDTVTVSRRLVK